MPSPMMIPAEFRQKHTPFEDLQGLAVALLTTATGLVMLSSLGFITGQTAGLALIISYLTGWSFGLVFFVVNLPFYAVAWKRLGAEFTLKSIACVGLLSLLVDYLPLGMAFEHLNPILGTVLFGCLTGYGLLGTFRHQGSLGGLGVVALVIQDRTGFRAGYVQLIVDAVLFAVALFYFDLRTVGYSLFGAVILNGVIAFNHRRDRYIAD